MVAIRGVSPDDQHRYNPIVGEAGQDLFQCFGDANERISHSAVNDGYCDCQDGSDEPGTEACAGQRDLLFYCPNELSLPSYIYTSHVNDGVCDCCDGSDEWQGRISCLNSCDEEGRALRQMHEQRIADLRNGLGQRLALIEQGRTERNHVHEELAKLRTTMPQLEAAERNAAPPLLRSTSFVAAGAGVLILLCCIALVLWRRSRKKVKLSTADVLRRMEPLMSVLLRRESAEDMLGIHVEEAASGGLVITSLESGGVIDRWNSDQQNEASRVRVGDSIIAIEHSIHDKKSRRLAFSAKDMEMALKSTEMVLTVSAPREQSELLLLSGVTSTEGFDLKKDAELSEVNDGDGGLLVTNLGSKLKQRNDRLRLIGACITQLIEVGDRLIPFDDGEPFACLAKFRFPEQVRLDTSDITLERTSPSDRLGMHLRNDAKTSTMKLVEIVRGSLLESACRESEVCKVLVGDHLISANGKESHKEMSAEFREASVALHFGRYVDEDQQGEEMPRIRPSEAFSPKRLSQSLPLQSDGFGLKFWLFLFSVVIVVVAVALAILFDPASNVVKKPLEGPAQPAVPSHDIQEPVAEKPQVSEYAKWMDGAEAALSESDSGAPEQRSASSSDQVVEEENDNHLKHQIESISDGWFIRLLKQIQTRILGVVKYVVRTESYSAEEHNLAKSKVSESRQREKDLEKKLAHVRDDNDDLLAYSSLGSRCISKRVGEYKYEACFFTNAKQDHMNIGTWKRWEKPHVGLFDEGTACPGGPARSLRVKMRCGSNEEIADVGEPSRCAYEAIMTHPAACSDARLEEALKASRGPRLPYVDEFW